MRNPQDPGASGNQTWWPRRRRRLFIIVVILFGPGIIWFTGASLYALRPLPTLPTPSGSVVERTEAEWGTIVLGDKRCVLINNVWNKKSAGPRLQQEVFVESGRGNSVAGWRWRAPWQAIPRVVSQPQVVCGDKPWDEPRHLMAEFPFHVEAKRVTADFDVQMQAVGDYNMSFTMWAVRSLPAARDVISHEIMIWIAKNGQAPAGRHRGAINVQGVSYDVYVEEGHKDASGANKNIWTYVAFVARKPILQGPLDLSVFTKYLMDQKLLARESYITSVELGNEVCNGAGIVELQKFGLRFE